MSTANTTHVPAHDRSSTWERDDVLRRGAARALGSEEFGLQEEVFAKLGVLAGDEIERLGAVADRNSPTLIERDRAGNAVHQIEYHPAYRRLEDIGYREFNLVSCKYDPELRGRGVAQRVGFLRSMIFSMGESGMLCPLCMTDGVARVLEKSGDEALAKEVIPQLCFGEGEPRATGAMFLTEKAGGSDVGANETVAREDGGGWVLSGEKWFSSNVDAEWILALARPEGGAPGTRGLGLFLIERAAQTSETFSIARLKDKLGTRTMPTGEVILADAPARLVGPLDAGFKQMANMLNLSRLYNAAISVGLMGRAWIDATSYAKQRKTFGKPVAEHPLAAEVLETMRDEYAGSLAMVLEAAQAMDRADSGDSEAGALLRALTPLIKLFTAKVAVAMASEAVEFLGGNGYVEDWPAAKLLRDAQVLPIWEGTTNILSLDLVRVASKGGLAPLVARARAALAASSAPSLAGAREAAKLRLNAAEAGFNELAGGASPRPARRLAMSLARAVETALLLEAAEPDPDGIEGQAARRLASLAGGPCI